MTEEEQKAIERLFHFEHINGYLDLTKKEAIIPSLKIKEWQNDVKLLREAVKKLQADIEKRISFEVIKELKNKIDDKISEVETNRSYGRYKQYGGKIKLDSYLAQLYGHKKAFEMLLEMEKSNDTENK